MKKLYFSVIIFCLSISASIAQVATTWQNYFSNATVKIESKEIDYQEPNTDINKKLIVFKLTNLTSEKITVDWNQKLQYGTISHNSNGNNQEMNFKITIEPNSSIEGDPQSHQTNGLVILSMFNSPEVIKAKTIALTNYELKNIQVFTVN